MAVAPLTDSPESTGHGRHSRPVYGVCKCTPAGPAEPLHVTGVLGVADVDLCIVVRSGGQTTAAFTLSSVRQKCAPVGATVNVLIRPELSRVAPGSLLSSLL